jgi:thiamine biosynthesis lipoprotein
MVASDRWEGADGWYEVLTARAEDLPMVAEIARNRVAALERSCSSPDPDSEVNRLVSGPPQQVSSTLAQVVAASLRATQFSQGAVATAVGDPAWRNAGSPKDSALLPAVSGIVVDERSNTVTLPPGLELELWPIARAWTADQIAEACQAQLGIGCLVNLGGDIAVRGDHPGDGWRIAINDGQPSPTGTDTITMGWPGGLASVSAEAPLWPARPVSGRPSAAPRHWRSVTVAAHSCERAKAACLTALALADSAPRWLTQRELPARLVHTGGIAVQTPGWPSPS